MQASMKSSLKRVIQKLQRSEEGVTLVELLLALVISTIFAGIIITVFLSGTLGFRLTNDSSSLRAEADYLIASVMQDLNQTKFDAMTESNGVYTFHVLNDPKVSANGILYRESGYIDTGKTLSAASFSSSSNDVVLQSMDISIVDGAVEARVNQPSYYKSGLIELTITLSPANDPSETKTFKSAIPF